MAKDKFDLILEKHIGLYLDSLNLEEEFALNEFVTPAVKRAQLKQELINEANLTELSAYFQPAYSTFKMKASSYLNLEEKELLHSELANIENKVAALDLENLPQENFQTLLNISDQSMAAMLAMASSKFSEGALDRALAILFFLTTLNPANAEYLFRLGITA